MNIMLNVASIVAALAAILVSSDAESVQIASNGSSRTDSRTLEEIHLKQRRFVLFNR